MRKRNLRSKERGMALLMALLALFLISAIGLGMMYMSTGETAINMNYKDSQTAFFAMRAGLEEGRDRLRTNATVPITGLPTTQLPGTLNSILYITNPAAGDNVDPITPGNTYFDDELCHETVAGLTYSAPNSGVACAAAPPAGSVPAYVASTSPYTGTASALNYKWVRITLKQNNTFPNALVAPVDALHPASGLGSQVCWNSATGQEVVVLSLGYNDCVTAHANLTNVGPLYIITSFALTPSGSRRIGQYEVAGITVLPPPGALSLDGPGAAFPTAPNSHNFTVDGIDGSCTAAPPAGCATIPNRAYPAVGVTDQAGVNNLLGNPVGTGGSLPTNRYGNYVGCLAAGSCATAATGSPSIVNNAASLTGLWSDPVQLNNLVQSLANSADVSESTCSMNGLPYNGHASPCGMPAQGLGTNANPQITFVNGDLSLNGAVSGAGVLVVTGNLSFGGNTSFNGLVLVVGQGNMSENGGGSGEFDGQVFVANTLSHGSPFSQLATLGQPIINWTGGGGNGIYYNSCWADRMMGMHYSVEASREEMY